MATRLVLLIALQAAALALAGCNTLGPAAVSSGRAAYNEAISETSHQQIFQVIANFRYQEPSSLLAVSSINANFRLKGEVGVNLGFGPDSNFAGNLVPLSAGTSYEENPTITYTPVQGIDYLREILGPIPLELTILAVQASPEGAAAMAILVKSINAIRNPIFVSERDPDAGARFIRVAELISALHREELVSFARDKEGGFVLVVPTDLGLYRDEIIELTDLLGISRPPADGGYFRVPILLGAGPNTGHEIRVETRSILDLIRIAGAAMAVPEDQVRSGLATATPPLGFVGRYIQIPSSTTPPSGALVAARAHGVWYYISDTDQPSKAYFTLLEILMNARIADAAGRGQGPPILTLPISN